MLTICPLNSLSVHSLLCNSKRLHNSLICETNTYTKVHLDCCLTCRSMHCLKRIPMLQDNPFHSEVDTGRNLLLQVKVHAISWHQSKNAHNLKLPILKGTYLVMSFRAHCYAPQCKWIDLRTDCRMFRPCWPSSTVYITALYTVDEDLHGWNVLQSVVNWYCCIICSQSIRLILVSLHIAHLGVLMWINKHDLTSLHHADTWIQAL